MKVMHVTSETVHISHVQNDSVCLLPWKPNPKQFPECGSPHLWYSERVVVVHSGDSHTDYMNK